MKRSLVFLIGLAFLIFVDAWLVEPFWIRLRQVEVPLPESSSDLNGLRILHVSDLHFRFPGNRKKIIDWARKLKPELIVLTGDLIEEQAVVAEALEWIDQLPRESEKYAVLGDWEHWSKVDLKKWKQELEERHVKLLINECQAVPSHLSLVIAGTDDPSTGRADLARTLEACPSGYRILLAHAPVIFQSPLIAQFQLTLAGHCHGGQIRLPGIGPLWLPAGCPREYDYGLHEKNGAFLYVTAGAGTSIFPLRFLSRPEAALIHFISRK